MDCNGFPAYPLPDDMYDASPTVTVTLNRQWASKYIAPLLDQMLDPCEWSEGDYVQVEQQILRIQRLLQGLETMPPPTQGLIKEYVWNTGDPIPSDLSIITNGQIDSANNQILSTSNRLDFRINQAWGMVFAARIQFQPKTTGTARIILYNGNSVNDDHGQPALGDTFQTFYPQRASYATGIRLISPNLAVDSHIINFSIYHMDV